MKPQTSFSRIIHLSDTVPQVLAWNHPDLPGSSDQVLEWLSRRIPQFSDPRSIRFWFSFGRLFATNDRGSTAEQPSAPLLLRFIHSMSCVPAIYRICSTNLIWECSVGTEPEGIKQEGAEVLTLSNLSGSKGEFRVHSRNSGKAVSLRIDRSPQLWKNCLSDLDKGRIPGRQILRRGWFLAGTGFAIGAVIISLYLNKPTVTKFSSPVHEEISVSVTEDIDVAQSVSPIAENLIDILESCPPQSRIRAVRINHAECYIEFDGSEVGRFIRNLSEKFQIPAEQSRAVLAILIASRTDRSHQHVPGLRFYRNDHPSLATGSQQNAQDLNSNSRRELFGLHASVEAQLNAAQSLHEMFEDISPDALSWELSGENVRARLGISSDDLYQLLFSQNGGILHEGNRNARWRISSLEISATAQEHAYSPNPQGPERLSCLFELSPRELAVPGIHALSEEREIEEARDARDLQNQVTGELLSSTPTRAGFLHVFGGQDYHQESPSEGHGRGQRPSHPNFEDTPEFLSEASGAPFLAAYNSSPSLSRFDICGTLSGARESILLLKDIQRNDYFMLTKGTVRRGLCWNEGSAENPVIIRDSENTLPDQGTGGGL